jgi:hydrogenase maturation protease
VTGSDPICDAVLVLGVGNEYRRDDGAGLRVAEEIADRALDGVSVCIGTGIIGSWDEYDRVYVVDAVRSGSEPGTIHRLDAVEHPLPAEMFRFSSHAFGVADAIELARRLGQLPDALVVYGIEGRDFGQGRGLTPEVARAAADAVHRLLREIGP